MNGIWLRARQRLDDARCLMGYGLGLMEGQLFRVGPFGIWMVVRRDEEDSHAGFLMGVALVLVLTGAVLEVPLRTGTSIFLAAFDAAALLVIFSRRTDRARREAVRRGCLCLRLGAGAECRFVLCSAFRPFWLNYDDPRFCRTRQAESVLDGVGRKGSLGREFEKWCATSIGGCADARVFHLYYGRWLPERDRPFAIHDWADVAGKEPLGDKDFYMFSRTRIVQGMPQPKAKPIVVLAFRGYEMAWIYRGSDLARENYRFGRP